MTLSHFQITAKTNIVIWVSIHMHFIYCYFSLGLQNYTNCELTLCILTAFESDFAANMTKPQRTSTQFSYIKMKQWIEQI